MHRNIPSDTNTDITNALKVRGLLCDETVINLLNLDLDAQSELSKMEEQSLANIEQNLEQMQMMGQAGIEGIEETGDKTSDKSSDKTGDKKDDKEVMDLTETQKAQKLTADNKKEQEKAVKKQVAKEE